MTRKKETPAAYGCPHCGSNDYIVQWDYVAVRYGGAFGEDGVFEDDGDGATVEWDAMLGGDHVTYVCRAPKCPGKQASWTTPRKLDPPQATPEEIEAARARYGSHELEVDEGAAVSRGEDGTWVQAWVLLEGR